MFRTLLCSVLLLTISEVHCQSINLPSSISIGDVVSSVQQLAGLLSGNTSDILGGITGQTSGDPLQSFDKLLEFRNKYNIGAECLGHTFTFMQGLMKREDWALQMVDAIGKPPSGLLEGKIVWLGDWEECRSVKAITYDNAEAKTNPHELFTGKYCQVKYKLPNFSSAGLFLGAAPPFTIGVCLPSSCASSDGENIVKLLTSLIPLNTTLPEPSSVTCNDYKVPWNTRAIIVMAVCSVFAFVIAVATLYDVLYIHWLAKEKPNSPKQPKSISGHQNGAFAMESDLNSKHDPGTTSNGTHIELDLSTKTPNGNIEPEKIHSYPEVQTNSKWEPGLVGKMLLSFSAFTNGTKLLNTRQPKGSLTAVNGIRFFSMSWVIVGHSYVFIAPSTDNYLQFFREETSRFAFMPILNGTLSVDSFFLLSGLLLSYLTLKELKKKKGAKNLNWGLFYFHRFWRLTPPYMLFLMMYVSLNMYWGDGPLWNPKGAEVNDCNTWWTNLFYINNLVHDQEQCFGWAWYLANDMQFFVLSPLMLVPLYHFPVIGAIMCLAFLLVSTVSSGLISMHYELPPHFFLDVTKLQQYSQEYYMKPWCRVGPYAVGVFTGYLLYKYQAKSKLPKVVNLLAWLVATTVGVLMVYGVYSKDLSNPLSLEMSAVYNATSRSLWGACVGWVIFSCATGNGGPVNHILSWPGFVPLGRLSYGAYLVHPVMMDIFYGSVRTLINSYDYAMIYITLGHLCVSYAGAFVVSLAFEAPMMGLEKILLGRVKNS